MSILIVEDDKLTARTISKILSNLKYPNDTVFDGESCLKSLEKKAPDLILLDYMLPGISGLEVLQHIRSKYTNIELPIIFVTSKTETNDVVTALNLGASDYIKKPINIDIISARIKTQLQLKKYYFESLNAKEVETLNAMIITYNHEINNPLSIAINSLELVGMDPTSFEKNINRAAASIERISQILRKINSIRYKNTVPKEMYAGESTMVKISKK